MTYLPASLDRVKMERHKKKVHLHSSPSTHALSSLHQTSQWSLRTLGDASQAAAESSPVCITVAFRWLSLRLTRGTEWVMIVVSFHP